MDSDYVTNRGRSGVPTYMEYPNDPNRTRHYVRKNASLHTGPEHGLANIPH